MHSLCSQKSRPKVGQSSIQISALSETQLQLQRGINKIPVLNVEKNNNTICVDQFYPCI